MTKRKVDKEQAARAKGDLTPMQKETLKELFAEVDVENLSLNYIVHPSHIKNLFGADGIKEVGSQIINLLPNVVTDLQASWFDGNLERVKGNVAAIKYVLHNIESRIKKQLWERL